MVVGQTQGGGPTSSTLRYRKNSRTFGKLKEFQPDGSSRPRCQCRCYCCCWCCCCCNHHRPHCQAIIVIVRRCRHRRSDGATAAAMGAGSSAGGSVTNDSRQARRQCGAGRRVSSPAGHAADHQECVRKAVERTFPGFGLYSLLQGWQRGARGTDPPLLSLAAPSAQH